MLVPLYSRRAYLSSAGRRDNDTMLWATYTEKELLHDFHNLSKRTALIVNDRSEIIPRGGYKLANAFFQFERLATEFGSNVSFVDYFYTRDWDEHSVRQIYKIIQTCAHPPAQFPASLARACFLHSGATKVLDPFAGWGNRFLAAASCGIEYIGCEQNLHLESAYCDLIEFMKEKGLLKAPAKVFSGRSEEVLNLDALDFDLFFSSPPFFKRGRLYEKYNGCEQNWEAFLTKCLLPLARACLEKGVTVCWHLFEEMANDLSHKLQTFPYKRFTFNRSFRRKAHNKIECVYCWKTAVP